MFVLCVCAFQWGRIGISSERPKASDRLPRTVRIALLFPPIRYLLCTLPFLRVFPAPKAPASPSLVLTLRCHSHLFKGVCAVQFVSRLVFRGRLLHHTLQRPRGPAIPQTHQPHQEHPHPTVEGKEQRLFVPVTSVNIS